jgi:hypothetical protein
VNPTFDSMMAAMGWVRLGEDGTVQPVDVREEDLSDHYGSGWAALSHLPDDGMLGTMTIGPFTITTSRRRTRLAPRWQVPAIKRRKADATNESVYDAWCAFYDDLERTEEGV